jgi:hypothetical protein
MVLRASLDRDRGMRCQEYGVPFGDKSRVPIICAFAFYLLQWARLSTIIIRDNKTP